MTDPTGTTGLAETDFVAAWRSFREQREDQLRAPHGFLAITGLHWLSAQPQRFEDVPGEWVIGRDGVTVTLRPDERLSVAGALVSGSYAFGPVDEVGVTAEFDVNVVEIAERFGMTLLRPRHPDGSGRGEYSVTPTYAPDERWVIAGQFEAYESPRPTHVDSVIEGKGSVIDAVGELTCTVGGREQRLIAFDDDDLDGGLWVLFTDETSGVTTYAASRQLQVAAPATDGQVLVDFNRAVNMPCAYTDYATCPLPPLGNHVDVMVEAGEKIPPRCG